VTSPRTPRQWNAGSEEPPADVTRLRGVGGEDDVVRLGNGWWIVAPDERPIVSDDFADGFPWRAGASIPTRLWPLSEVLPETPEPPREDWQPKPGERVIGKLFSHPDDDIEGEFVGHRGDFVSNLNVGAALWCAVLRATLRPAASQSVPAVPVSSTGGKETGEAAETATEALRDALADLLDAAMERNQGASLDSIEAWDFEADLLPIADAILAAGWRPPLPATGPLSREQLGEKVRAVATAWSLESDDRPGAGLQTWEQLEPDLQEMYMRCGEALFGLGMTFSPVPASLPDRETERPRRCPALVPEGTVVTEGRQCQQYEGHSHLHTWYGDNGAAYSAWRVTS
jgi:hypothetical protein